MRIYEWYMCEGTLGSGLVGRVKSWESVSWQHRNQLSPKPGIYNETQIWAAYRTRNSHTTEELTVWITLSSKHTNIHIFIVFYIRKELMAQLWHAYKLVWAAVRWIWSVPVLCSGLQSALVSARSYIFDSFHDTTKRALSLDWCDPNENHINLRMSPTTSYSLVFIFFKTCATACTHTTGISNAQNPLQATIPVNRKWSLDNPSFDKETEED